MKTNKLLEDRPSGSSLDIEWGSISDAQKISGNESRTGIYRAIRRGELIAVKRGNRTLIDLDSARRRARNFPRIVVKIAGEE